MKSKVKIPKTKASGIKGNKPGTTNASSTSVGAKTMSKKGKIAIK